MEPFILLLEDDPVDAARFLVSMQNVKNLLNSEEQILFDAPNPDSKPKKDAESCLSAELADCGVTWVTSLSDFAQIPFPEEYSLWIIDLRLSANRAIDTWELLDRFQPKAVISNGRAGHSKTPPIWVLSHYAHLNHSARRYASVQKFFPKTEHGYLLLEQELFKRYSVTVPLPGELEFTLETGQSVRFLADKIIAFYSRPRGIGLSRSHRQTHYVLYLNGAGGTAIHYPLTEKMHLMKDVLAKTKASGFPEFIRVSRGTIINAKQITHIEHIDRDYLIRVAEYNDGRPIRVAPPYAAELDQFLWEDG